MRTIKKVLPSVLAYLIGIVFLFALCLRARQIDNNSINYKNNLQEYNIKIN
jgi:hypothetical protein